MRMVILIDAVSLLLPHLPEPPHGAPHTGGSSGGVVPGTSSNSHTAALVVAKPDANSRSLHLVLATEGAAVLGMLADLHLLDSLPEAGSIPGAVLASNSDLLGALGHGQDGSNFSCRSESSNNSL